MTSTSDSHHGNPTRIVVLKQKWATLKEMQVNKNFNKWLNLSRQILEMFGEHLTVLVSANSLELSKLHILGNVTYHTDNILVAKLV
jgi:hypothetical protein